MNYRQWKKNYKKKYGVNPPPEIDKRKRARTIKKVLKQIDFEEICNLIIDSFSNVIKAIGKAFCDIGNSLIDRANELQL